MQKHSPGRPYLGVKAVKRAAVRRFGRTCLLAASLSACCGHLAGQSAPGNAITTPTDANGQPVSGTQIAVPGGAGASAATSGSASAGPILGFQVWQQDRFFLASFFTFSVPQTFSGQAPIAGQAVSAQQSTFGSLLLNPPAQGTSYSFTGNKMFEFPRKQADVAKADFFVGGEVRAGITNATWTEAAATPISLNATIAYIVPEFLATSKTYTFQMTDNNGKLISSNQYQFGLAAGPTLRFIGGDVAQKTNDAVRAALLGTTDKEMAGLELTFFVRMNQFKPYVRFTHFSAPQGNDIPGFSGSQFVFGVDVLSPLFQTTLP